MSNHLDNIINKHNQTSNLQVVFIDIEKYSKRRTSNQVTIINSFTKYLRDALQEISKLYISFIEVNDINLSKDIIIIPTGDGAAVNFSFEGLHDIHLKFSELFLRILDEKNNESGVCTKFDKEGWCNCHDKFNVRIGVSEGKSVVYKDVNANYNVAGNIINTAARLLNLANRNQILFDEAAYKLIIDMGSDPNLSDKFIVMDDVKVKHDVILKVYIYNPGYHYINGLIPSHYIKKDKINKLMEKMSDSTSLLSVPMKNGRPDRQELRDMIFNMFDTLDAIEEASGDNDQPEIIDIVEEEAPLTVHRRTRRSR